VGTKYSTANRKVGEKHKDATIFILYPASFGVHVSYQNFFLTFSSLLRPKAFFHTLFSVVYEGTEGNVFQHQASVCALGDKRYAFTTCIFCS